VDQDGAQHRAAGDDASWLRAAVGELFRTRRLATPLDRLQRHAAGKRSLTRTQRKRGHYVRSRPLDGRPEDLAFDATLRAAAPFQRQRHTLAVGRTGAGERRKPALVVRRQDLQRKVRVRRASNLVVFVVDASWSMAAAERIEATKGAVLSLLHDAYQRRDKVGMIVFRGTEAEVVLAPTSSVELAQRVLREIPVGGKTPLSAGLWAAYQVCRAARRRDAEVMPLIVILTDGAGNIAMTALPAQEEAWRVADLIRQAGLRSVVLNMEHPSFDSGLAQRLATALGGAYRSLTDLRADSLVRTVRDHADV
jgi:Mg-chelatase subunit ChlD